MYIQVAASPDLDAQLADIAIGTSAAPTYFPAHYFKNPDEHGTLKEFNLIDGGVAANNPVSFLSGFKRKITTSEVIESILN